MTRGSRIPSAAVSVGSPALARKLRCAVYTRKSSEEGLELEFNSLDAQRESCEAYVVSQRAEGWVLVPDHYDDGGISGGTLQRPALQRLIADIERGLVDVVVVYKIDRLSRSLMDFARLVTLFEANHVTFVSVTQAFNTTTSMGRLTLNVLLSFAQFEREVSAERIRDKFAASRARGMWMGGRVPWGYRLENKRLVIDEPAAATVRSIFTRFVALGSATILAKELASEGVRTPSGKAVDKGVIYRLLSNRVYVGDAVHKGVAHPGEHEPIVSRDLWNRAQSILQVSPRQRASITRAQTPALLKSLIFTSAGSAMSPSHTRRRGRLYRYYVSQAVLKGRADAGEVRRLPAGEIETAVVSQLRRLLRTPEIVVRTWRAAKGEQRNPIRAGDAAPITEAEVWEALQAFDSLWAELFPAEQARVVHLLVERVEISPAGASIRLRIEGLDSLITELRAVPRPQYRSAA